MLLIFYNKTIEADISNMLELHYLKNVDNFIHIDDY